MCELFDCTENPVQNFCHVVIYGESINCPYNMLFDENTYDTLYAVTYVSSASFFSKIATKFKEVHLILGSDKSDMSALPESIMHCLSPEFVDFYMDLDDGAKKMLANRNLTIRYAKPGKTIHSKFYILVNSETKDKRLIIGSANLSANAFEESSSQYEEVLVFDSNKKSNFDTDKRFLRTYKRRYRELEKQTVEYISPDIQKKLDERGPVVADANFLTDIMFERINNDKRMIHFTKEELTNVTTFAEKQQDSISQFKMITDVISKITKRSEGRYVIRPPEQLIKPKIALSKLMLQKGDEQVTSPLCQYSCRLLRRQIYEI